MTTVTRMLNCASSDAYDSPRAGKKRLARQLSIVGGQAKLTTYRGQQPLMRRRIRRAVGRRERSAGGFNFEHFTITYRDRRMPAGTTANNDNRSSLSLTHVRQDSVRDVQYAEHVSLELLHGSQRSICIVCDQL